MTAPANDNFADAIVLSGSLPITRTGDTNVNATTEVGEPLKVNYGEVYSADEGDYIGQSAWYSWTCGTTDTYRILIESDFDSVLSVYTGGTLLSLTRIDQSELTWASPYYEVVYLDATAGTTYQLQVAGYDTESGTFDIEIDTFTRPVNDAFANAIELTGSLPITESGDSTGASKQSGEPGTYVASGITYRNTAKSVWYKWTAPASQPIDISATPTSARFLADGGDMAIGVYTGSSVSSLTTIADDSGYVTFDAVAGTTYRIQVGGYLGNQIQEGEFDVEVSVGTRFYPDATPVTLTGGSATVTGSNDGTGVGTGERVTFPGYDGVLANTAWWSWEADADGVVTFDTFDSDFDTTAASYTGGTLFGLSLIEFNDDYEGGTATIDQSKISWDTTSGETYFVQVGGTVDAFGDVTGHFSFSPYPSGDEPDTYPPLTVEDPYRIELRALNSAGYAVTTASLDLVSFSCNWRLNAPGAFEGTGVKGVVQADAANVGARELVVYKGDTAIWGGYLTFFDIDEDTKQVRVGAEGLWSRARGRLMRGNQIYKPLTNAGVAWKADVIAWDIIDQAQGVSYGDMGWVYGGHTGTRKNCKRTYYGVDRTNVGEAIEALAREGYFDFSVDVRTSPTEGNVAMFRTWYERGTNRASTVNLSASNAMQLNYSLSSSDMATVIDVFGSVEGCRGVAATETANLPTYGRVEARPIDMETDEQAEVDDAAARFIDQHGVPAKNATATYLEGVGPDLTDYDIGDTIRITPSDGYVSYFDGRVVGREIAVEAGRAVVTVEVER